MPGAVSSPHPSPRVGTGVLTTVVTPAPCALFALPADITKHIVSFLTFLECFPLRCAVAAAPSSREAGAKERLDQLLFSRQVALDLNRTTITSAGLSFLCGAASKLKKLSLRGCKGLRNEAKELWAVSTLVNLRELNLSKTKLGSESLVALSGLRSLTCLNLCGCDQITDTGLAHLSSLPLTNLNLIDCRQITETGLAHFPAVALQEIGPDCGH